MGMLRRWAPMLAVAALLAATGIAASMTQLPLWHSVSEEPVYTGPLQEERPAPSGSAQQEASYTDVQLPGWVTSVLIALVAVAVLVLIVVLVRAVGGSATRFRRRPLRRRDAQQPPASLEEEVVAAIEAGLLDLDEIGTDPRRAVIACWVRLERAAAAAGTARQRGDTSSDLVLRLLAGHHLSEGVLTGFADVYRQARYASRDVDESMRDHARAALTRLHGELTQAATA